MNSQNYSNRGSTTTQSVDISKQDFTTQVSPNNATTYGSTASYPSQKTSYQPSNATPNSYNTYSGSTQSFPSVTGGNTNSYSATVSVSQASYNTSYPQSSTASFSQASPSVSVSASAVYNQTTTANQVNILFDIGLSSRKFRSCKIVNAIFSIVEGLSIDECVCPDNDFSVPRTVDCD